MKEEIFVKMKNVICYFFGHKADKTVLAYNIKSHDTTNGRNNHLYSCVRLWCNYWGACLQDEESADCPRVQHEAVRERRARS